MNSCSSAFLKKKKCSIFLNIFSPEIGRKKKELKEDMKQ